MLQLTWPYTSGQLNIDFLQTKQEVIHLLHYRWSFFLHIFSSLIILAAGLTQFSNYFLRKYKRVHRWIGKAYVFLILFVSAPAALCMSFYALGGPWSQLSFVLLSILWWSFTFLAYQTIRQGMVAAHRRFMIRSYALTLSAITLRAFQFLLPDFFSIDPATNYLLIGWTSWLGNLVLAEIYLYFTA